MLITTWILSWDHQRVLSRRQVWSDLCFRRITLIKVFEEKDARSEEGRPSRVYQQWSGAGGGPTDLKRDCIQAIKHSLPMCCFFCPECYSHLWPLRPPHFHFDVFTSRKHSPSPTACTCLLCALSALFLFLLWHFIVKHLEQDPAHSRCSKTYVLHVFISSK